MREKGVGNKQRAGPAVAPVPSTPLLQERRTITAPTVQEVATVPHYSSPKIPSSTDQRESTPSGPTVHSACVHRSALVPAQEDPTMAKEASTLRSSTAHLPRTRRTPCHWPFLATSTRTMVAGLRRPTENPSVGHSQPSATKLRGQTYATSALPAHHPSRECISRAHQAGELSRTSTDHRLRRCRKTFHTDKCG